MATHEATIHPFPAQERTCNYCTRPVTTAISANGKTYCAKLCAAMGLIAEVHDEDVIDDVFPEGISNITNSIIKDDRGRVIPFKVREQDALDWENPEEPEGCTFQMVIISNSGTPDWEPIEPGINRVLWELECQLGAL